MPLGVAQAILASLTEGRRNKNEPKVLTAEQARKAFMEQQKNDSPVSPQSPSTAFRKTLSDNSSLSPSEIDGSSSRSRFGRSELDSGQVIELPTGSEKMELPGDQCSNTKPSGRRGDQVSELPAEEKRAELAANERPAELPGDISSMPQR